MCYQKSLIDIKRQIQTRNYEIKYKKRYSTEVVTEKSTFLSSNKNKEA